MKPSGSARTECAQLRVIRIVLKGQRHLLCHVIDGLASDVRTVLGNLPERRQARASLLQRP